MQEQPRKTVSMWRVAWQTSLMLGARKGYFTLYASACVAFALLIGWWMLFTVPAPYPVGALCSFLFSVFMGVSLLHFTIGSCRSRTSFFPMVDAELLTHYKMMLLALAFMCVGGAFMASLPANIVMLAEVNRTPGATPSVTAVFASVCLALLGGSVPFLRFGPVLGAAAIGDYYGLAHAWKMTKRHTLKLMIVILAFAVPPVLATAAFVSSLSAPEGGNYFLGFLALALFALSWFVGTVFFGILYEELNRVIQGPASKAEPDSPA